MAVVLKFVRGATEVSLQGGSTGIQLAEGWRPVVQTPRAGSGPAPVVESLPVNVVGSSHDNLASLVQSIHEMQVWAAAYLGDRMERTPVWLVAQMSGESYQRRALVYGIEISFDSGWFEDISAIYEQNLLLAVSRGPWESTAALTSNGVLAESAGAVLTLDYTAAPGADVTGDLPARVGLFQIATESKVEAIDEYDRFWVGLRSSRRHGTLANFAPLWECEDSDATLGTDAALAADATASPTGGGNTKVTVTPGTATWEKRLTLELRDFTTNYTDNFGRFLALLRAKISAGTWEAQLKFAYANGTALAEGPIIEVDGTSWDWYEMGQHGIPQRDLHALSTDAIAAASDKFYQVQVWARRTSGAGSLDLDCVVNLPIDEGYAVVKGADLDYGLAGADSAYLMIGCSPEETFQAVGLVPNGSAMDSMNAVPQLATGGFYFPVGDGRAYIVYAGPTASDLTDKLAASVQWWPRWLSLRGAE